MLLYRMVCLLSALQLVAMATVAEEMKAEAKDGGGHDEHGGGGGGYEVHDDHGGGGGYEVQEHGGGGYGHSDHGGGGGGGYGHQQDKGYKPHPPKKCHPQTITKYKTVHKDRKANVYNQVEVLNPQPHVKKIKETRDTTIRYPVFITQVIKPLLTQVETKVKPIFFTKTINKYTTVFFTVTGIGQVTVTSVKYEKEYITRCQKKGYGHHRREYGAEEGPSVRVAEGPNVQETRGAYSPIGGHPQVVYPPPGIPYNNHQQEPNRKRDESHQEPGPSPRIPNRNPANRRRQPPQRPQSPPRKNGYYQGSPRSPISPLFRNSNPNINRGGHHGDQFQGKIGDIKDLYMEDIYYYDTVDRMGRAVGILQPSHVAEKTEDFITHHPVLEVAPVAILI